MDTLTRDGKRVVAYLHQDEYTALRERAFDDRVTVSEKLRQIVRAAVLEAEDAGRGSGPDVTCQHGYPHGKGPLVGIGCPTCAAEPRRRRARRPATGALSPV